MCEDWHNGVIGLLVTFTHICLLVESSLANAADSSSRTVSCKTLEKETFWKVAQVVCKLLTSHINEIEDYLVIFMF